jgi:CheY-like chemotaxis protein
VRSVGDPLAVLGLLQDWPADLLISDVLTVPVEGLTLLERLRGDPACCDLPTILLTPETQFDAQFDAQLDQLHIPCKRARLLEAIEKRLSRGSKPGAAINVAKPATAPVLAPDSERAAEPAYNPLSTMMIKAGMDHRRSRHVGRCFAQCTNSHFRFALQLGCARHHDLERLQSH